MILLCCVVMVQGCSVFATPCVAAWWLCCALVFRFWVLFWCYGFEECYIMRCPIVALPLCQDVDCLQYLSVVFSCRGVCCVLVCHLGVMRWWGVRNEAAYYLPLCSRSLCCFCVASVCHVTGQGVGGEHCYTHLRCVAGVYLALPFLVC